MGSTLGSGKWEYENEEDKITGMHYAKYYMIKKKSHLKGHAYDLVLHFHKVGIKEEVEPYATC